MMEKMQFFLQNKNDMNHLYHTIIMIAVFLLFLISCGAVFFGWHDIQTVCIVVIHLILLFITFFFINQKQKRHPLPSPSDKRRLVFFLAFSVIAMILVEISALDDAFIHGNVEKHFMPKWLEIIPVCLWLFFSAKINTGIYLSHQKENRFHFTNQDNHAVFNTGIFLTLLFFLLTVLMMPVFGIGGIFSYDSFSILTTSVSFIILIFYVFFLTFAIQNQNEYKITDIIITVIFAIVFILAILCFYWKQYTEFISIVVFLIFLIWCGWARLKEKQMNHVRFVNISVLILLMSVIYLSFRYAEYSYSLPDYFFHQWFFPAVTPVCMMYIMHTSYEYYCIENTAVKNNKKTYMPMIFTAVSGLYTVSFIFFVSTYIGVAASVLLLGVLAYQYISVNRNSEKKSIPVMKPKNVSLQTGRISSYISYICFILCMILPFSHYYFGNTPFHTYLLWIIYMICFGNSVYTGYKKIKEYRPLKTGTIVKTVLFILFSLPLLLLFSYGVISLMRGKSSVFPSWLMFMMIPLVLLSIYMFFGLLIQEKGMTYSTHRIMFIQTFIMTFLCIAVLFARGASYRIIIYIYCIITSFYMIFLSYTGLKTCAPEYKFLHYLMPSLILVFSLLFYFGFLTPIIKFIISLIIPLGWGASLYFNAKDKKEAKQICEILAFLFGVLLFLTNVIISELSLYEITEADHLDLYYRNLHFFIYMAFPICLMTVITKGIEFLLTQEQTDKKTDFSPFNEDVLLISYIVLTGLVCSICTIALFNILTGLLITLVWVLVLSIYLFGYRRITIDRREKEIQQALKEEENNW